MVTASDSPTGIGATLRHLRQKAGLSQTEAARLSGVNQVKISRLERGLFTPQADDVQLLARAYRASPKVRTNLERAAKDAAASKISSRVILQRGVSRLQAKIARIEAASAQIRSFHPLTVPGLLQTPDYARLVIGSRTPPGPELDQAVAARIARQRLLVGRDVTLITTEGALLWHAGSPHVMIEQIEHIMHATTIPGLRIGLVLHTTPLQVFPQEGFDLYDSRAVIIGTETATATITDPRDIAAYERLCTELDGVADYGASAYTVLADILATYQRLA